MLIKRIKLKNIRTHHETEINFNRGITVFTGRTGSGKSSILMAIEYALFGSECGIPNNAILMRGKQQGYVELEFQEKGNIYRITRGLKRQGKNVVSDSTTNEIYVNGKKLNLLGRATDLNQKIKEILNYPEEIKAKELFEITSYTKQDEIRTLIEMRPEKRQEYIDKILQLSKYKSTSENMREVINFFELLHAELSSKVELLEKYKEELSSIEEKMTALKELLKKLNSEIEKEKEVYQKVKNEAIRLEEKRNELLKQRREYDSIKGKIEHLEKENTEIEKETLILKEKSVRLSNELKNYPKEDYESLKEKFISISKDIEFLKTEIYEKEKEVQKVKDIGEGECPLCKQKITKEHLVNLEKEFEKTKQELEKKINELKAQKDNLEKKTSNAKKAEELSKELEIAKQRIDELEKRKIKNNQEIVELNKVLSSHKFDLNKLNQIEQELKHAQEKQREVFSKIQTLSKEHALRKEELQESAKELYEKKKEIEELENMKKKLEKLTNLIKLLKRLRNDIKDIRDVVRMRFLEDFKQEFQRKFEEIRKYEEEYSVDIKNDYEPVAYASNGEEVPITHLSGGEKTSVALAYRLALADLAAQISSINPSEMLILDEPTTGLDQEDIKALPEALRNIKTIPQIIIVTHDEELKNAADYKFEVIKEGGKSSVREKE